MTFPRDPNAPDNSFPLSGRRREVQEAAEAAAPKRKDIAEEWLDLAPGPIALENWVRNGRTV